MEHSSRGPNQTASPSVLLKQLGIRFTGVAEPVYLPKMHLRVKVAIYVFLVAISVGVLRVLMHADWFFFIVTAGIVATLGFFVPFVRRTLSLMPIFAAVMQTLAVKNGFAYRAMSSPDFDKQFAPALAKTGIFEKQEQIVSGVYEGYEFRTYLYTTRHPFENRIGRVTTRVYELTLPKKYPHIFLATRRTWGTKLRTNTYRHFDDDQRMQLEGNFEDLFISYTHRRTNTDARVILAPNVMQTIIDTNQTFNMEIINNKLYLTSGDYLPTVENIAEGFGILHAMIAHMNRLNRTMKFVLPNDSKYPYLHSRMGFGTVYLGGKYFNASIIFIAAWSVWSVLRIFLMGNQSKALVYGQISVLAVSDIVLVAVLLVFRKKHKNSL